MAVIPQGKDLLSDHPQQHLHAATGEICTSDGAGEQQITDDGETVTRQYNAARAVSRRMENIQNSITDPDLVAFIKKAVRRW